MKSDLTGTALSLVSVGLTGSAYAETLNVIYLILCILSVMATLGYYALKIYANVKDRLNDGKFDSKDARDTMADVKETKDAIESEADKIKKK